MKRLLFVVNNPAFFVSHRLPIGLAARDRGWDVHVATPRGDGEDVIRSHGLAFHPIPLSRRGAIPTREIRSLFRLYRLFARLRPDVVHLVTIKPLLYGSLAAQLARIPRVVGAVSGLGTVYIAQGPLASARRALVELGYRLALAHKDKRVIFQNPDDRAQFVGRGLLRPDDAVLIRGSGVDTDVFRPSPEPPGPPTVVLPSRMLWDKGVGEFVEAARLLHARNIAARFVLAGGTDPGNATCIDERQLCDWVHQGAVEWWGHRKDMPAVFAAAHVVCLPSYREGLPKALIEAAACGKPLVATDVPGCREVVSHGANGLLVPPRNAAALADALEKLIVDPELRRSMCQASRDMAVRHFSLREVVERTLELYELSGGEGDEKSGFRPRRG